MVMAKAHSTDLNDFAFPSYEFEDMIILTVQAETMNPGTTPQ